MSEQYFAAAGGQITMRYMNVACRQHRRVFVPQVRFVTIRQEPLASH